MGEPSAIRDQFRATFFSGWGVLLALAFIAMPAFIALMLQLRPETFSESGGSARSTAIGILVQSTGAWAGLNAHVIILAAMVAAGAWTPTDAPVRAFLGRAGAVATLMACGWFAPALLLAISRAGGAAFYPALAAGVILLLSVTAWVAIFCLVAEMGFAAPGVVAFATWFVLGHVVPLGRALLTAFFGIVSDGLTMAWFWTNFTSPDQVSGALRGVTFPRTEGFFGDSDVLPAAHGVPLYAAAALAWILLPVGILWMGARPRPVVEDDAYA